MNKLAADERVIFVGQSIVYDGQRAFHTFKDIPEFRKIEFPVCEDFGMGFCTGLALAGHIPVYFLPRWDFLLMAANQLVNHLDKLPLMAGVKPVVIIRTAVGSDKPLDPGPQHVGDHTEAFKLMLKTVGIVELRKTEDIVPFYVEALHSDRPTVLVERMELYNT